MALKLFLAVGPGALPFGLGTLCLIGGCLTAPPRTCPIPKLRVGSALVTSVRRSPVRRRGFFFARGAATFRRRLRPGAHMVKVLNVPCLGTQEQRASFKP